MSEGTVIDSVMPLTTSPIRWSMTAKACSTGRFGTRSSKRLLSRRISESVRSRSRWMPALAFTIRPRSARNGVVARLITTLPAAWASSATWGATPVPVPPPDQQLAIRLDRIEMNRVRVYYDRSGAVDSHAMQTMNGVPTRAAASDHDDLRAGGAKRVEERLVPGALRGLEAYP